LDELLIGSKHSRPGDLNLISLSPIRVVDEQGLEAVQAAYFSMMAFHSAGVCHDLRQGF